MVSSLTFSVALTVIPLFSLIVVTFGSAKAPTNSSDVLASVAVPAVFSAAAIVGNVLTNVIARPQFIAYKIGPKPLSVRLCEAMGAVRAGWTSRAWTHERDYDIVIFEHYRPGAWFRADI